MNNNEIPAGGLTSPEELKDFQYVRTEFVSPVFKPKITLNYDNLTFNASCVKLFPDTEYIQMLVDPIKKRMLLLPCNEHDKASIKWSNIKYGKPQSRNIRAKVLCAKLFRLMNWQVNYRYKIMAVYQELNGQRLIVLNLSECEMYVPEDTTTKDGKGKRRRVFPLDWENTFGSPYSEHSSTYDVDINAHHLLSNVTTDDIDKPPLEARVPTAAEIITRQYYIPDDLEKDGGKR